MKEEYKLRFEALEDEKKWDLGNGVFVEDLMYEYGSTCDFERLAHSFVLDTHDSCWKNVFTPAQLKIIKSHGNPALMDYDLGFKEIFSSLSKAVKSSKILSTANTSSAHAAPSSSSTSTTSSQSLATFIPITSEQEELIIHDLWKTITEYGFIDPKTRYNEHWIQKTMIEIIDLYQYKVIDWVKNGSEMDFVIRIWSMLDRTFDDLFMETRRDKTYVSAAAINSKDRAVTGLYPVADKITSVRPDIVLYLGGTEYGAGECGKGGSAKKVLVETSLHCPKVMRSMFLCASDKCDNEKDLIRTIRIACFAQFHLHASASIMDNPGGYVCRGRATPRYEVSNRPSMLPSGLLQILKLTLKIKRTTQATIKIVEDHLMGDDVRDSDDDNEPDIKSSHEDKNELLLPALMQCNYKKQKRSN